MNRFGIFSFLSVLFFAVAAGAQPQAARVVDIKAPDGTLLNASYFAAAKPGPGVLLLHQGNRERKVWDDLATQLAAAGIDTLTLDMRGFGESGGKPHDTLTAEERGQVRKLWPGDIDAAWSYLVSQPGVDANAIGLAGAGFDGVFNAVATARLHSTQVKSLVLLSGQTDLAGRQFLRQAKELPALFVVADNDEYPATVEAMELAFLASSNPGRKFVHYAGVEPAWQGFEDPPGVPASGGHGTDLFKTHPELQETIAAWLRATLIETPGRATASDPAAAGLPDASILDAIETPGGVDAIEQRLTEARVADPKAQLFPEAIVRIMGYDHLAAGETKLAVAILKLDVTAYPGSPDAHDSLADAYLADGDKELARSNCLAALILLRHDTIDLPARQREISDSANGKLAQMGGGQR